MSRSITAVDTDRLLLRDLENNGEDDSPATKSPNRRSFLSIAANFPPPSSYSSSSPPTCSASTSPCPPPSSATSSSHAPTPIFASLSK
ncbi:hypothetical protein AHAS_Ahas05G0225100 [Arachis hypogaea]